MFRSNDLHHLFIGILILYFCSNAVAGTAEKIPNLQCHVSGEIVFIGFSVYGTTKVVPKSSVFISFSEDQIDVDAPSPFQLYGKFIAKEQIILARYVDNLNGNKYDRLIEIRRDSGSVKIHSDDFVEGGKRIIGDVRGYCEKVTGKKF